jgi:superfamily II DNA or RNA helicase
VSPDRESSSAVRIADLTNGVVLRGVRPGPVTVLTTIPHGPEAVTLVFRDAAGTTGDQLLYATDLAQLTIEPLGSRWLFDADGDEFRLAAEALRIRMAGLHDPMLAVSSSDVEPLPHQIRAVYAELLPRTPLRFLLADDPGAGKTIMAGLYAKELILRGDLTRMLIIAPGGLVDQWQEELSAKFGITTQLLSREMAASNRDGNPFSDHPMLVARMDQLARDDELRMHLSHSEWDLIVVDEAHRMSASWWGGELRTTKRYELGKELGDITRHLLLMTATPHAGSEENYQAFLALLDPDRFEGRFREGAHTTDTTGLMRRMIKEELLTFEGKPLFPERIAETVPYELSGAERDLYESVTQYVRVEMNRADSLPDSPRTRTVGFALTVLQRRLASSTHAILRSLERRRARLESKRLEMLHPATALQVADVPSERQWARLDDPDEIDAEEVEQLEEDVVDAATAARTAAELEVEIRILSDLVTLATQVRDAGEDRKWAELRSLLLDKRLLVDDNGDPRKLIVFTEHRDTLNYLHEQICNVLGRNDAVLTIHGGTRREDRRRAREEFTHNPDRRVLLATDAAGEGLNLQAAHLMINYDLPWNPNRLEQRFGRIHRIGQQNTCRLWNLVANNTREGQVFTRLLEKMEQQRRAYGGRLFDVLGDAFGDRPLRDLLIEAIRYGDDPAKRAELDRVVDAEVAAGLTELLAERALSQEALSPHELERLRKQMDEARARRLQPHYVELFFKEAFSRLGGRMSAREQDRFEINNVPAALRTRQTLGAWRPLATRYDRVTFEPTRIEGRQRADLLAPGHPLMDVVLDLTIEQHRSALERGSVLVDRSDSSGEPRLVVALVTEIIDGTGNVVSKRFSFVTLTPDGKAAASGPAPYLDAEPLVGHTAIVETALAAPWLAAGVEQLATSWAITQDQPQHLSEVRDRILPLIEKTRSAVRSRLTQQANYLESEAARLRDEQGTGRRGRPARTRVSPERLIARARELEARLEIRLPRLDAEAQLAARPPRVIGAALILPAGLFGPSVGVPTHAKETEAVERRAVDAILAAERTLGRTPEEMPHNNKGFDIRSSDAEGRTIFIEVKGRIAGADDFFVTYNEVLFGKNAAGNHRLALVSVHPDGAEYDTFRYVLDAFRDIELGSFAATGVRADWHKTWSTGAGAV